MGEGISEVCILIIWTLRPHLAHKDERITEKPLIKDRKKASPFLIDGSV